MMYAVALFVLVATCWQGIEGRGNRCVRYGTTTIAYCAYEEPTPHDLAVATCEAINLACHLAILRDPGQNQFVYELVRNYQEIHAFIGLNDQSGLDDWVWVDGFTPEDYNYVNWSPTSPVFSHDDVSCGAIVTDFGEANRQDLVASKWNNGACTDLCPFVCECPVSVVCDDPHFMLPMQGSSLPVCFDYQGHDHDMVQMIYDKQLDLVVNALLMTVGSKDHTYFQEISVLTTDCRIQVRVNDISVNNEDMDWKQMDRKQMCGEVVVSISEKKTLTVEVGNGVELEFSRRTGIEHLNFFILNSHGLSVDAKGILGELARLEVRVEGDASGDLNEEGWMTFPNDLDRAPVQVVKKERLGKPCWRVGHSGYGLLHEKQEAYKVPGLNFRKLALGL